MTYVPYCCLLLSWKKEHQVIDYLTILYQLYLNYIGTMNLKGMGRKRYSSRSRSPERSPGETTEQGENPGIVDVSAEFRPSTTRTQVRSARA
jgi:hypothetical protein